MAVTRHGDMCRVCRSWEKRAGGDYGICRRDPEPFVRFEDGPMLGCSSDGNDKPPATWPTTTCEDFESWKENA